MDGMKYLLMILLVVGCTQSTGPCPPQPLADLSGAAAFASDNQFPFQFPLEALGDDDVVDTAHFCEGSRPTPGMYHAAEDYWRPPGTPVYAMAAGKVSFSGRMRGYGWLVIIDHPQANLYSLYGHLSPSRWRLEPGPVEKGELIGYLGDSDENGGSAEKPLRPHLHFGIRAGQRADYPSMGEWRWQAGWIRLCPADVGWLHPSMIIANQQIPVGGFLGPTSGFVAKWGFELLLAGIYLLCGLCMFVFAIKRNKPFVLVIAGVILSVAGWYFYSKGTRMSYAVFAMAILLLAIGICKFVFCSTKGSRTQA